MEHIPIKEERVRKPKQPDWFNDEIRNAIYTRDQFKRSCIWNMYKIWQNKVTSLIKNSKRNFFNKAVENRSDQKILWENLKTSTNNDAPFQLIPSNVCINDTLVEGTESVINELNKHFY